MSAIFNEITRDMFSHSSGIIPAKKKCIVITFPLTEETACKSLSELRELFSPLKEKLTAVIRTNWHDSYDFQQYRSFGAVTTYNFVVEYQVSNLNPRYSTLSEEEYEERRAKTKRAKKESENLIEALKIFSADCPDIF